jgi:hypothetical protein
MTGAFIALIIVGMLLEKKWKRHGQLISFQLNTKVVYSCGL